MALPIHVSQSFPSVEMTDAKQASLDMPWFYIYSLLETPANISFKNRY